MSSASTAPPAAPKGVSPPTKKPPSVAQKVLAKPVEPQSPFQSGIGWLIASAVVVLFAVIVVEWAYSMNPIPPGPDTGKWIATSYAYINLPYPSYGSFANPFSYPPVTFVFIGATYLGAGNPYDTAFVFNGILLAVWGLSLIHLSRRYLLTGPIQFGFVSITVLSGTVLSMLFWGGLPNFLAFILLNEAVIFLLAFLRSKSVLDAVAFWGFAALIYLTHDLTFAIAIATIGFAGLILLVFRKLDWRTLLGKANLIGLAILVVTVGGYVAISDYLKIPHPGYLFSNPAAYVLNPIGLVFNAVTIGCSKCFGDNLPNFWALFILFVVPIGTFVGLFFARRMKVFTAFRVAVVGADGTTVDRYVRPLFVDNRLLIAWAWLAAVCLVPAVGWLIHVDTDYTRFGYFFPVPVLLFMIILVERSCLPWLVPARAATRPSGTPSAGVPPGAQSAQQSVAPVASAATNSPSVPHAGALGSRVARGLSIAAVLLIVIILAALSVPLAQKNENNYAGPYASAEFEASLAAVAGLSQYPGSVLADSGHTAHWVEATTARNTYFPGPTWLHFYPFQILRDEQSYWAFNSEVAITNNQAVLSFSGTNDTIYHEMPMYTVYIQGVVWPVLRIDAGNISVTYAPPGGKLASNTSEFFGAIPSLTVLNSSSPAAWLNYTTPYFVLTAYSSLGQGGNATVTISVEPMAGVKITKIVLPITQPPAAPELVRFGTLHAPTATGSGFVWPVGGHLGSLPGSYIYPTYGNFSLVGIPTTLPPPNAHKGPITTLRYFFNDTNPTGGFSVTLWLSTPGTSNPAITLPTILSSSAFYASQGISLVILPYATGKVTTQGYLQGQFGFQPVSAASNAQWVVLSTGY